MPFGSPWLANPELAAVVQRRWPEYDSTGSARLNIDEKPVNKTYMKNVMEIDKSLTLS